MFFFYTIYGGLQCFKVNIVNSFILFVNIYGTVIVALKKYIIV